MPSSACHVDHRGCETLWGFFPACFLGILWQSRSAASGTLKALRRVHEKPGRAWLEQRQLSTHCSGWRAERIHARRSYCRSCCSIRQGGCAASGSTQAFALAAMLTCSSSSRRTRAPSAASAQGCMGRPRPLRSPHRWGVAVFLATMMTSSNCIGCVQRGPGPQKALQEEDGMVPGTISHSSPWNTHMQMQSRGTAVMMMRRRRRRVRVMGSISRHRRTPPLAAWASHLMRSCLRYQGGGSLCGRYICAQIQGLQSRGTGVEQAVLRTMHKQWALEFHQLL